MVVFQGFQGGKRSAQASAHPLSPAFVCLVLLEFWLRLNEMHEVRTFASCKGFFFVFLVVVSSSLENYFRFRTTNVIVKTDHSVSLRWNKTFQNIFKQVCIFLIRFESWFCVQCFAFFRLVELKTACVLLLVVMVTFFTCPDLFTFAEPALSLSSVKEP